MNNETQDINLDSLPELRNQKLLPYRTILRRCPKCGMVNSRCPVWLLRLFGVPSTDFKVIYCRGGEHTEKQVHILPGISQTVNPVCAGVLEEHLHVHCLRCAHHMLMQARPAC